MMSSKDSRVSDGTCGTFPVAHSAIYEIRRARGGERALKEMDQDEKEDCCRVSVLRNQLRIGMFP